MRIFIGEQFLFVSQQALISSGYFSEKIIRFSMLGQGNSEKTVRISERCAE